jgi:23S rRNA-/tRNA-specific pseudouridylate synthase
VSTKNEGGVAPASEDVEVQALQERLEKARIDRSALEDAEIKRKRVEKLRADVEAEEQSLANEKKLAELEQIHGPAGKAIKAVYVDTVMVVVKKPNHLHVKRFMDKEETKSEDLDMLVRPCLVYPSKAEFDALVEAHTALLAKAANAVSYLAGFRKEDLAKK